MILDDFMALSALLTGQHQILKPTEQVLHRPTADQYLRALQAVFPTQPPGVQPQSPQLSKLLGAYQRLAAAIPTPAIDDQLLGKLRAEQDFKDHEFVAKQIVNIWYFSQFKSIDDPSASFLDGGFYDRGLVWPRVKAHPIGFSNQPHGYWTEQP